jgi:hypothetical protein
MLKPMTAVLVSSVLSLAVSAQSATTPPSAAACDSPKAFRTIDSHKANFVRLDPDTDWSRYVVYRFTPATYQPSNPRHSLTPRQIQKIESNVDTSLQGEFRHEVERSGAVLEVKPVITDVKKVIPLVNLVSFLAVQAPVSYGGISVRYELFDASTGTQVGEIESKRNARPWNIYPWDFFQNFQKLGHSSLIAKRDARTVRKDLNRLPGLPTDKRQELVAGTR